jgi:hypothetical protein
MRRHTLLSGVVLGLVCLTGVAAEAPDAQKDWAMNATIIEACSCPMFCQCYFDTRPAAGPDDSAAEHKGHGGDHGGHAMAGGKHYCKFNNAFQVNTGHYGQTNLDGARFWVGGDLGDEFSDGEMDWAVLHFDPSVTKEQREGIKTVLGHLYPVKWKSFTVGEDKKIDWKATRDKAEAKLDGGKAGEVVLKKNQGMSEEPIVIKNLKYWGAPRNEGFVLMQNETEALREVPKDQKPFEFKRTNGFMITFDINSKDVAKTEKAGG